MKKLGTVKIMGKTWKIYLSDRLPENIDGLTTFAKRIIEITDRVNGDDFALCWWHEFGHAVLYELGMYLTGLSPEVEELLVDAYAKAVCQNAATIKKMTTIKK